MSSAALIQLVAYGAQDLYITGYPQITFFKSVYKRYTNYAIESVQIPISGDIAPGKKVSITIPKTGDLLKRLWIHYNPSELIVKSDPTNVNYICSDLGHALFERLELEIGGQIIDTHYGKWLSIWRDLNIKNVYSSAGIISDLYPNYTPGLAQLSNNYGNVLYMTTDGEEPVNNYQFVSSTGVEEEYQNLNPNGQAVVLTNSNGLSYGNFIISQPTQGSFWGYVPVNKRIDTNFVNMYDTMAYTHIGTQNINQVQAAGVNIKSLNLSTANAPSEAYIPMQFWFCRHPGLALPLIALQYHEVKFNITFNSSDAWVKPLPGATVNTNIKGIKIFGDYIYLDSNERKKFSQNAHEYLIDQVQLQTIKTSATQNRISYDLVFNHPVKELVFTGNPEYYVETNKYNPSDTTRGTGGVYYRGRTSGGATPAPIITSDKYINDYGCPVSHTNTKMTLVFNGVERFSPRNLKFFTRQEIYSHHNGSGGHYFTDDIGVYSFCLKSDDNQPSGSCNMSRLDRVSMVFSDINTSPGDVEVLQPLDVYAVNYNVLRIMSGMGGLAYSN